MRRMSALLIALGLCLTVLFSRRGWDDPPNAGWIRAGLAPVAAPALRGRATEAAPAAEGVWPAASPPSAPGRTGRVVDLAGRPVAHAWLEFDRKRIRGVGQVRADERGCFPLPEDVGAQHLVGCWCEGYYGHRGTWSEADERGTIRLRPQARLEGRVLDDRGEPVSFVWVRAEVGGRLAHERPAGNGVWRMYVTGGIVRLRVTSQAGLLAERQVTVHDGESVHWDLVLPAPRTFRPRVLPPPAYAGMSLGLRLFAPQEGTLRLDAEDGYLVNDWSTPIRREAAMTVPPERAPYWLVVFHEDHDALPLVVHGPLRGAPQDVEVRVPAVRLPSAVLEGRLPQDSEEPETSRIAKLVDAHGFHAWAHVEDESGHFRFDAVPPGRYELRITSYGGQLLHTRPVGLAAQQVLDLGALR